MINARLLNAVAALSYVIHEKLLTQGAKAELLAWTSAAWIVASSGRAHQA